MTPGSWHDLFTQRARRLETNKLGNIRRVSWRSADARMLQRLERSQPRDVLSRVYNESRHRQPIAYSKTFRR